MINWTLKLTEDNVSEWRQNIDEAMKDYYLFQWSENYPDQELIDCYLGDTIEDVHGDHGWDDEF